MAKSPKYTVDDDFTLYVLEDDSENNEEMVLESTNEAIENEPEKVVDSFTNVESVVKHFKELLEDGSMKKPYNCLICNYTTSKQATILSHMDAHLQNRKQYKCKKCNFTTFTKQVMTCHEAQCDAERKLQCDQCDYVTIKHKFLTRHIKYMHLERQKYRCGKCRFKTDKEDLFQQHQMSLHPKPSHNCDLCSFKTISKGELKKHKKVHIIKLKKQTIFRCDLCSYENSYKINVTRHRTKHIVQ